MNYSSVMVRTVFLAVLIAGCRDAPTDAGPMSDGTARVGRFGNLVQTVTLSPAVPVSGENVLVRSVVVNQGSSPVSLATRICGLDYAGTLELDFPAAVTKCAGYSMHSNLAPGDSIVVVDVMQVSSPPGRHRLRVRQSLDPETWVTLSAEVRAP